MSLKILEYKRLKTPNISHVGVKISREKFQKCYKFLNVVYLSRADSEGNIGDWSVGEEGGEVLY